MKKDKGKKRRDRLTQLQAGNMDKYVKKQQAGDNDKDLVDVEEHEDLTTEELEGLMNEECATEGQVSEENIIEDHGDVQRDDQDNDKEEPINEVVEVAINKFENDFNDPGKWGKIDQKTRDFIIEKGPVRVGNENFPLDNEGRHFASKHYYRELSNGEKYDRAWLVYSNS